MKTLKVFINACRKLTFNKLIRLLRLFLGNPIFSILSFIATYKAYKISAQYFPQTNSTDGKGNAFRHALWCCLILMYCCKVSSPKKSIAWCKKLTSLHEEIFPNEPLQKQMDLHNNAIGIQLFEKLLPGVHRQFFETSFFVDSLIRETEKAVFISHVDEDPGDHLMYIQR
ncbi:hypothetical protein GNY06_04250 [Elizabethkingia argentiflava]|uniref:DUF6973 domain-containing protein n=1 Tax=Elizabethkingia argenteiflava TaxID=2681556 RepID=A0A845PQQ7_9FLAO|nr:hypothetical protein [Elizabethkingia argenteiflava]NAW50629.1 hypothetical protein [Elizabethkingia argenteiflava]